MHVLTTAPPPLRQVALAVLGGVTDDRKGGTAHARRALALYRSLGGGEDVREAGTERMFEYEGLHKLVRTCTAAGLVDDAIEVLDHARAQLEAEAAAAASDASAAARAARIASKRAAPGTVAAAAAASAAEAAEAVTSGPGAVSVRKMGFVILSTLIKQLQLGRAMSMFRQLAGGGSPPPAAACAALLDALCARGLGADAAVVLEAMHAAAYTLNVKLVCQVLSALVRNGLLGPSGMQVLTTAPRPFPTGAQRARA